MRKKGESILNIKGQQHLIWTVPSLLNLAGRFIGQFDITIILHCEETSITRSLDWRCQQGDMGLADNCVLVASQAPINLPDWQKKKQDTNYLNRWTRALRKNMLRRPHWIQVPVFTIRTISSQTISRSKDNFNAPQSNPRIFHG